MCSALDRTFISMPIFSHKGSGNIREGRQEKKEPEDVGEFCEVSSGYNMVAIQ